MGQPHPARRGVQADDGEWHAVRRALLRGLGQALEHGRQGALAPEHREPPRRQRLRRRRGVLPGHVLPEVLAAHQQRVPHPLHRVVVLPGGAVQLLQLEVPRHPHPLPRLRRRGRRGGPGLPARTRQLHAERGVQLGRLLQEVRHPHEQRLPAPLRREHLLPLQQPLGVHGRVEREHLRRLRHRRRLGRQRAGDPARAARSNAPVDRGGAVRRLGPHSCARGLAQRPASRLTATARRGAWPPLDPTAAF
mmetsp:Transcript_45722/g.105967  ORF Transcript_45722/g.105967 Transcript_45722/m.105967 type:complete len:249 (-) Transcript_45722:190-936(-)